MDYLPTKTTGLVISYRRLTIMSAASQISSLDLLDVRTIMLMFL